MNWRVDYFGQLVARYREMHVWEQERPTSDEAKREVALLIGWLSCEWAKLDRQDGKR